MTQRSRRRVAELAVIDAARALHEWHPGTGPKHDDLLVALSEAVDGLDAIGLEDPTAVRAPWPVPETSREAAEYMAGYVGLPLGVIWLHLHRAHRMGSVGMTCDQIEERTGIRHGTASARINQLRDTGWIKDSGQRRPTRSGRNAIVWTPTDEGLKRHQLVPGWGWRSEQ